MERTCDRVAILHRGRVVREGTVEGLDQTDAAVPRPAGEPAKPPPASVCGRPGRSVVGSNGTLEVEVPDLAALNRLVDALRAERLLIAEISPLRAALEDVFVEVVGRRIVPPTPEPDLGPGPRPGERAVKTWALIVDTWREALARYTLLGFLVVSSLFLLILTFALNLDIVDGALAAGTLFGKALELPGKGAGDRHRGGRPASPCSPGCSTCSASSSRCSPPAPRCPTCSTGGPWTCT